MMIPESTEFTPDELTLIAGAINAIHHPAYTELREKVARLRLIGKEVRFDHKGTQRRGILKEFLDWEDIRMARIQVGASYYIVGENALMDQVV